MHVQVGDHAYRVRQVHAVLERAAALVVHEHERHRVGPVDGRERRDDRLQQLRLAGPGGPRDQPVRAVAAQVDPERAVEGLAHHRDRAPPSRAPQRGERRGRRRLQVQHVEEPAGLREAGGLLVVAHVPDRREPASDAVTPGRRDVVGPHPADGRLAGLLDAQSVRVQDGHGLALRRQQPLVGVQADRVDPDLRPLAQQLDDPRHRAQPPRAVQDHDRLPLPERDRAPGLAPGLLPRGHCGEQFRDPRRHGLRVVADQHVGVLAVGRAGVREPAYPIPAGRARRVSEHAELQVVGAVQGRGLGEQPPADRPGHVAGSRYAEHAAPGERHSDRGVGDVPRHVAPVLVLGRVLDHHRGGEVRGPDP